MMYTHEYDSPVGTLTLASDGASLTGLWLAGQKYFGQTLERDHARKHVAMFDTVAAWLDEYFSGSKPKTIVPLAPSGSPFRQRVWELLQEIPFGKVTTYGEIARKLNSAGHTASARAVGGAVGHNPISIIIPCHRVVGSDGSLTGFAGGIDKKRRLLRLEKSEVFGKAPQIRRSPQ